MYNLKALDLNLLTVLEALYIERNLTRAAERVSLSQPAMSNALARLRSALDDELFVRQGRTMQPTPKARQMAFAAQQALKIIRDSLNEPATFDLSMKRNFVLCGSEHCELVLMPLLAMNLGEAINNIHIKTIPSRGDFLARLKSGEADIVLDYRTPDDNEFSAQQLVDDTLVCLIRRDHEFKKDTMTLEDFAAFQHVVPESALRRFFLDNLLRSKGISRNIVMHTNNVHAMPVIVENSDLMCTMSRLLADVVADEQRFRRYPAPIPDPAFPLHMVWHKSMDGDPGHAWVRDYIINICRSFFSRATPTD